MGLDVDLDAMNGGCNEKVNIRLDGIDYRYGRKKKIKESIRQV